MYDVVANEVCFRLRLRVKVRESYTHTELEARVLSGKYIDSMWQHNSDCNWYQWFVIGKGGAGWI